MSPDLVGKLLLTTAVVAVFALGRWLYARYFKAPVVEYSSSVEDLGEDNPVVEALLTLREKHVLEGNHTKALEYSSKALERCPMSNKIKALTEVDKRNASQRI